MSAGLNPRAALRGFTLIELIVVVALVAIMMGIAAPSFVRFQRSSELTSTANSFLAAMSAARAEAMKRNRNAYVMPVTANDWSSGWNVFVDLDGNAVYDASDYTVMKEPRIPSRITTPAISGVTRFSDGSNSYVLFNGSGFPRLSNGNFATSSSIEFLVDSTLRRRVIMNPAGRMRVCDPVVVSGCAE